MEDKEPSQPETWRGDLSRFDSIWCTRWYNTKNIKQNKEVAVD